MGEIENVKTSNTAVKFSERNQVALLMQGSRSGTVSVMNYLDQ